MKFRTFICKTDSFRKWSVTFNSYVKTKEYGSQTVAIFKIVGTFLQDKIFNIQVCSFNIQNIKLFNYYTFKIQVYNSIFKIKHSIFKFVPSIFKIAYSVFKLVHSTFKFGIQYSSLHIQVCHVIPASLWLCLA